MHGYLPRILETLLQSAIKRSPVVVILGPRQCGKSTLAKEILKKQIDILSIYLDLQDRMDMNKLNEPEIYFDLHRRHLICMDEIQLFPHLFSILRSEIDKDRRAGRFLLLGSASRDLILQSSETLAGRVTFLDLTPFLALETKDALSLHDLWLRGGFPESALAANNDSSLAWRKDFIRTFLERDIPALGINLPIRTIDRLWRLLAHHHGQILNYSKLASVIDISQASLKKYIDIFEYSNMIRLIYPYETNTKKRIIKSPKLYIRDSGIFHSLADIETFDDLLGHPMYGSSWEGFALENILASQPDWRPSFLRSSNGAEVDLVLEKGSTLKIFEFKASKAPKPSRGFYEWHNSLQPDQAIIVAPVDESYPIGKGIMVQSIYDPI